MLNKSSFLLCADVARLAGLTPAGIRRAASLGHLRIAAMTPTGTRLFAQSDVDSFLADRAARAVAIANVQQLGRTSVDQRRGAK